MNSLTLTTLLCALTASAWVPTAVLAQEVPPSKPLDLSLPREALSGTWGATQPSCRCRRPWARWRASPRPALRRRLRGLAWPGRWRGRTRHETGTLRADTPST